MSTKKGRTLADVMGGFEDDTPQTPAVPAELQASSPVPSASSKIVPVSVLVSPEDRRRLRQLSLDTGLSIQKLGHEAFNMMLEARGLPPLEPVSANVPSGRSRR